ncbi:hypothetical protein [Deinococcus sonorensis]|uniref:DUF1616 domain-containing protein n=2 Tax=Deinococcus sonorensis TaxID=309891 RepID=A0AAU7U6N8_9DEIO
MTVPALSEPQGRATPVHFLLGYLTGAALYVLVRLLSGLNPDPCRGQTLVALIVPLLLGPGGLGLAASQWNRPPRAIFGLGLVVASLFPALFFGTLQIGGLRAAGCAGGYVVVAPAGGQGRGLSELTLKAGERRQLQVRIGGFEVKSHPDRFSLRLEATNPSQSKTAPVQVQPQRQEGLRLGQEVPLTLTASPDGPTQQYTLTVTAMQEGGRTAAGSVTVNVEAAPR